MRRSSRSAARDRLHDALEALQRDGEPVILRDGRRPVAVLITVDDYRKRFSRIHDESTPNGDGPTWPQVERREGDRRRGERRGRRRDPAPREGDPGGTLDVLRELRSLGLTAER
ncbi:MAG TPA: type II toxin-antitoxin system Phd/YefM family antitoxin [Actinomycetota bacterium]